MYSSQTGSIWSLVEKESYTQDADKPAAGDGRRLLPHPRPSSLPRTRIAACRSQGPAKRRRGSRGACAAARAAGPSLGGGARRGGLHGKGEVRWPLPPPPPPRFVARRKMADLEEQLSDEEKVRAAEAAESVVGEPVEPRRISPECGRPGRVSVCAPGSLPLPLLAAP